MRVSVKLIPVVLALSLGACDNMSHTDQNVVGGAALGALGGAAVGAIVGGGSVGTGALIGAGVGAVGGYLYDRDRYDY